MGETTERRSLSYRLSLIFVVCLGCLTIQGAVLIGAMSSGYSFVLSQAYMSDHDMIAKWLAILGGCLVFVLCCRKFAKDSEAPDVSGKTLILSGFGIVVLPFIFGIFVRATILTAYPLWLAVLIGKDTKLEFSVSSTAGWSYRCPNRVELAGMPIMTGTLCGVPDDFRRTLHQGTRVVLTGRGTAHGLFAAEIDVVH